jgi:peptidoglycan/LPS O-acetylase OafA/YrhL
MHRFDKPESGVAHPKSRRDGSDKDGFRPDIEGLRGLAVSLVVLFHVGLLSQAGTQITGGFIGVDLFFVVSGFLITGLLVRERERNGRISFSRFYARRVRRILPASIVVLLVTLVASNFLINMVDRPSVMLDGASAALSVANIRFAMTTDYFNPVNYSPFLHFWSLGVEEQFYFIWPALLAVVAWKMPRLGAAVALIVVVVASFVFSLIMTDSSAPTAYYILPTRAWQLAAGGLLAVGSGSLERLPARIYGVFRQLLAFAGWAALAALITTAFNIDQTTTVYPGTAALVPTIAGVLLIASGTERTGPGILLRLMPVRFLGKISYSLYLWHWPILILGGLYLAGPLGTMTPTQGLALAGVAVLVSTASWALIEEPFRRGMIPLPRPGRVVFAGVAVMFAVAIIGTSFDMGAQSALASLDGGNDATPTAADIAAATATPTSTPTPAITFTPAPDATPTPTPQMTPALTPAPSAPDSGSHAITSAIRPALGKAETDYEATWHLNCLGWEKTTVPDTTSKCVFGNPSGSYTVALVGDSHASALFPGVNEVAKAHGWKLIPYLKINCPFLDLKLDWYGPPRHEYPECDAWNPVVLNKLIKNPPNLILISNSRWISTTNDGDGTVTNETNSLIRMIKKLSPKSKVVIIADPPLPTIWKVPACLASNLTDYTKCDYSQSKGFNSAMGTREKNAAAATGAGLIDLTAAICPGTGACPVVMNNMIMWRDDHHLTATFSTTLGPAIDEQLVAILVAWATPSPTPTPSP